MGRKSRGGTHLEKTWFTLLYISCGLAAICKRALRNISMVAQIFDLRKLLPNGYDQKPLLSKGEDACLGGWEEVGVLPLPFGGGGAQLRDLA